MEILQMFAKLAFASNKEGYVHEATAGERFGISYLQKMFLAASVFARKVIR
jgi:hypothetical protein